MFEAVLVALADHGFTPTAISARLTLLSAPESIQGALAAGLLGGGSRFLGVTEDAANFLGAAIADLDELPADENGWDAVAAGVVAAARTAGRFVPGLGHPVHKHGDPRTPVMFQLAREHDVYGPHLELFAAVGEEIDRLGRVYRVKRFVESRRRRVPKSIWQHGTLWEQRNIPAAGFLPDRPGPPQKAAARSQG